IYTEKTECQDCYKCVRACPVKAIRVIDGSAAVIPEACILCGRCTEVCPVGAKKVRDDLHLAKELVAEHKHVYVSLAPSYRTEFSGLASGKLIAAIKALGFSGVSETALGAQEVSSACATLLAEGKTKLLISSCCPSAIHLIEQYYPHLTQYVTPVRSPLMAHGRILKNIFGTEIKVVFFGPCVAKKNESGDCFDLALTFSDLRRWFTQAEIDWTSLNDREEFVPNNASRGVLYPVDGGMIDGIKSYLDLDVHYMTFSGVEDIMAAFEDIEVQDLDKPMFIEVLSCSGGCVNGPATSSRGSTANKRCRIYDYVESASGPESLQPDEIKFAFAPRQIIKATHSKADIAAALLK
ncbi:MAG: [Fe-Fe] hydrogenase large subunit C-terminal domain-containing protein, partial [Candidatus Cloacimonadaceae bacterium]|nr:[Fe-Fe] hydrogenase large subunit C-terminal domain-containing protein [Candidatus Cloacimonadaceae bacterium]